MKSKAKLKQESTEDQLQSVKFKFRNEEKSHNLTKTNFKNYETTAIEKETSLRTFLQQYQEQNERLKEENRKMKNELEIIEAQRNTMKSTGCQTISMEEDLNKSKKPPKKLLEPKSPARPHG